VANQSNLGPMSGRLTSIRWTRLWMRRRSDPQKRDPKAACHYRYPRNSPAGTATAELLHYGGLWLTRSIWGPVVERLLRLKDVVENLSVNSRKRYRDPIKINNIIRSRVIAKKAEQFVSTNIKSNINANTHNYFIVVLSWPTPYDCAAPRRTWTLSKGTGVLAARRGVFLGYRTLER
jgi:hypothetical protein